LAVEIIGGNDQDARHGETIDPLWNLFDLTPEGRGSDRCPDLSYNVTGRRSVATPSCVSSAPPGRMSSLEEG
jgi:hypothetical protein